MNSFKPIIPALAFSLLSLGVVGIAFSDDDDDDDDRGFGAYAQPAHWVRSRPDVATVANATYQSECGACHMAYQPGLLPAVSWERIMQPDALGDHYGDDASLPDALRQELAMYLSDNAADQATRSRSRAFAVDDAMIKPGEQLPRISQTRYFQHEHDEIPARLVVDNPEVGSFSQCNACHRGAAEGVYNEHQVSIPGFGPWRD